MNLDIKKLVAEIHAVNHERRTEEIFYALHRQYPPPNSRDPVFKAWWESWKQYKLRFSTQRATQLYALRAHSRGRLHIKKEWIPTCDAWGELKLVERDMEWQTKLIAPILKDFQVTEEPGIQATGT